MTLELIADHLWQSTIVAAAITLLVTACRRNHAHVRYLLWLAASVKFLVPFAALTAVGQRIGWVHYQTGAPLELARLVETVGQPFSEPPAAATAIATAQTAAAADLTRPVIVAIWLVGCVAVAVSWYVRWRRVAAMMRRAEPVYAGALPESLREIEHAVGICQPTALLISSESLEPGVFGIFRPVLMWPHGIDDHLDEQQTRAIMAHEAAHIRRRDNLTAALHMAVEALFWFHPLVWWIGARLVEEREHACDEDVVRLGTEPQVYADGVLRACKFSIESPLHRGPHGARLRRGVEACVAGITGSNLRRRIELIMKGNRGAGLTKGKRVLLAAAAVAATAGPVAVGVVAGRPLDAQSGGESAVFEVASVRSNESRVGPVQLGVQPGGQFRATNVPLRMLIRFAYEMQESQIVGGPDWLGSDRFDVVAKVSDGDVTFARIRPMLKSLLTERFKLASHIETREMPIYALVKTRSDGTLGPKLSAAIVDCAAALAGRRGGAPGTAPSQPGEGINCGFLIGSGRMNVGGMPIVQLARALSPMVGRVVVDKTGLTGNYSFELTYSPEQLGGGPPAPPNGVPPAIDPNAPSLFTALQEQLGLKLEAQRGPVEVLVIDSAEQPSEN